MYRCICIHRYVYTHTHTYIYIYVHRGVCIYIYIHLHTCVYTHIWYLHIYIYIYMYTYHIYLLKHHLDHNMSTWLTERNREEKETEREERVTQRSSLSDASAVVAHGSGRSSGVLACESYLNELTHTKGNTQRGNLRHTLIRPVPDIQYPHHRHYVYIHQTAQKDAH